MGKTLAQALSAGCSSHTAVANEQVQPDLRRAAGTAVNRTNLRFTYSHPTWTTVGAQRSTSPAQSDSEIECAVYSAPCVTAAHLATEAALYGPTLRPTHLATVNSTLNAHHFFESSKFCRCHDVRHAIRFCFNLKLNLSFAFNGHLPALSELRSATGSTGLATRS